MTVEEYAQLKAFARQDGALLSLLWIGSFACYIQGLTNPMLATAALLLLIGSPFYAASRLRHFRDVAREGLISFRRGWAYNILIFFYGGLLLAAAVFIYFAYMDDGYLLGRFTQLLNTPEGQQAMEAYGMGDQVSEGLRQLAAMRPIDFALNALTLNISAGIILGLPIALIVQRSAVSRP